MIEATNCNILALIQREDTERKKINSGDKYTNENR